MKRLMLVALALVLLGCVETGEPYTSEGAQTGRDKVNCGTAAIDLMGYIERYAGLDDASGKLRVNYLSRELTCWAGELPEDARSQCRISTKASTCLELTVNTTHCRLREVGC